MTIRPLLEQRWPAFVVAGMLAALVGTPTATAQQASRTAPAASRVDGGPIRGGGQDSDAASLRTDPGEQTDREGDQASDDDASDAEPADPIAPPEARQSTAGDLRGSERDADDLASTDGAAFERPPAGYDAEAFSIEVEPILDRRPRRLFQLDPYAPIGVRAGGFTFFPQLETAFSANDNVLRARRDARSDIAAEVLPSIRAVSNWRTHALELGARATTSFHGDLSSEDDRAWSFDARARIDVARRTNIEFRASHEVTQELRGSLTAGAATGDRADITTDRLAVALNHRFNRLSVQLRGGFSEVEYGASRASDGTLTSNRGRGYQEADVAARATWELKPTFGVFAETQHVRRDRPGRAAVGDTGTNAIPDSDGERYRLGVSFGTRSQKIRGEASIGWGTQRLRGTSSDTIDGIIVDANVAWRPTALTTLMWTARSDLTDSDASGTTGVRTWSTGLEARHAFRRNLIGTAGLRWTLQDYQGATPIEEQELAFTLGGDYHLNREVTLFGRYRWVQLDSSDAMRGYEANEFRVGVRWRR